MCGSHTHTHTHTHTHRDRLTDRQTHTLTRTDTHTHTHTRLHTQFLILGVAETRRLKDYLKPGCLAADALAASKNKSEPPSLQKELVMALSTPPGGWVCRGGGGGEMDTERMLSEYVELAMTTLGLVCFSKCVRITS